MTPSQQLYAKLRENGIDFFVSVPCKYLAELISIVEQDKEVIYTPVTREEEGIGLCAGAYLAGKKPAILMQNSGLGNCVNAICSLLNYYQIPVVMVISHRGTEGELIDAQIPMGEVTNLLLQSMYIVYTHIKDTVRLVRVSNYINGAYTEGASMALLFPISYWREEG